MERNLYAVAAFARTRGGPKPVRRSRIRQNAGCRSRDLANAASNQPPLSTLDAAQFLLLERSREGPERTFLGPKNERKE